MFTFTFVTSLIALLCTGVSTVDARTLAVRTPRTDDAIKRSMLVQRDVVSPPITYPTTGTVWVIGSRHNVTWDTSVIPPGFKSNGMIVLGYLDDAEGVNEHLDLDHPLAKGFPITNGRAEITVPSVETRTSYILVLFGDSGNASGKFTIKNISIGTPPSSSSTAKPSTATSGSSDASSGAPSSSDDHPETSSAAGTGATSGGSSSPSSTGAVSAPVPTGTIPASQSVASGSSTAQTSPAAESAGAPTTSAPASAAYRASSSIALWISAACVLGVALGSAL